MKMKKILVLLFFAVAIIGLIAPINAVGSSISNENKVYSIESKKKVANLKITWNANGGKIGTKKTTVTTVKKGSSLNKLATTPKRSGYTFNGWFSAKNGGTKITKNTKPSKSVTYFAQWKKGSTSDNSKIIGLWSYHTSTGVYTDVTKNYYFKKDGTFMFYKQVGTKASGLTLIQGKYKLNNGKVYFTNIVYEPGNKYEEPLQDRVHEYKFGTGKNTGREYILISSLEYNDGPYSDIKLAVEYYKQNPK